VEKDRTRKHFSCPASQLEEYGFSRSPFMKIRHSFAVQTKPYTLLINRQVRSFSDP
jgi:hypothetical protein